MNYKFQDRIRKWKELSKTISSLSDDQLQELFKKSKSMHKGIGGEIFHIVYSSNTSFC